MLLLTSVRLHLGCCGGHWLPTALRFCDLEPIASQTGGVASWRICPLGVVY